MSKLKPYPKYKPVAYDYISQLPDSWDIWKISHIFRVIGSGTTPTSGTKEFYENGEIEWVNTGDLNDDYIIESKNKINQIALKTFSTLKKYPANTLLIAMYGATIGKTGIITKESCTNQACCALSNSKNALNRFVQYWFIANRKNIVNLSYGGGQPNISQDVIKKLKIPLPPLSEQNVIVAFLDQKTEQIQTFIAKKQRLIELLEEKKKAVINKAITQGIDKNVELVETNIEWFDKIPKHWELKKLKHFADYVQRGNTPDYVENEGIPVVSQAVFSAGFIDETKFKFQKKHNISTFKGKLFENDVLIASTGGGVLGKSFLFKRKGDYIADGHVTLIRDSKQRFVPAFLNYIFSINFSLIEGYLGQGSTNQTELQREWLRSMLFPFPPIQEQKEIVDIIDKECSIINRAITQSQLEIEKLKEYQESLITQVVTGQVRVG